MPGSRQVAHHLTMTNTQGDPEAAQLLKLLHDIAEEIGIDYGTCQRVLTEELGMHHVAAKFVSRILTVDQKQQHINVALNFVSSPPMMKPSCPGSSLVMRAGFTVTALRQSNNPPSGKAPRHQGQKRPDR